MISVTQSPLTFSSADPCEDNSCTDIPPISSREEASETGKSGQYEGERKMMQRIQDVLLERREGQGRPENKFDPSVHSFGRKEVLSSLRSVSFNSFICIAKYQAL